MSQDDPKADERAIRALIERQFAALCWSDGEGGDWPAFDGDFAADAVLYPAARPAKLQTVAGFAQRMAGLAKTDLRSLHEVLLGVDIRVFGNVALAAAGCEITENDTEANRGAELMLLVKTDGHWKIVAQAWDMERDGRKLPADLARASAVPD